MLKKTTISLFLLLSLLALTLVPTFVNTSDVEFTRIDSFLAPGGKKGKPDNTGKPENSEVAVDIRNIPSGDTILTDSKVLIIAEVTGESVHSVVYQVEGIEQSMSQVGSTSLYQDEWDTTDLSGEYSLTVKALDDIGNELAFDIVDVDVVTSYVWEIFIEIDYVVYPSTDVLEYMVAYWKGHAIQVHYWIDDPVSDPNADNIISNAEFWAIEAEFNDDEFGFDDRSNGGQNPKYTLKEKWMLYGTWDENSNVGGYTYVDIEGEDLLAGNYIFIAASMINQWETANGIPSNSGEVIVVCHELGHSIGIAVLRRRGRRYNEVYDSDSYSIMSSMKIENAKYMVNNWYYSKEYWNTRNMGYYKK